jgi:hypothetical protein
MYTSIACDKIKERAIDVTKINDSPYFIEIAIFSFNRLVF